MVVGRFAAGIESGHLREVLLGEGDYQQVDTVFGDHHTSGAVHTLFEVRRQQGRVEAGWVDTVGVIAALVDEGNLDEAIVLGLVLTLVADNVPELHVESEVRALGDDLWTALHTNDAPTPRRTESFNRVMNEIVFRHDEATIERIRLTSDRGLGSRRA